MFKAIKMATRPATMKERRIWALETLQMCYPDKHHEYELELDWHGRADPLKYFPSDHFIFDKDLLLEEDNFFVYYHGFSHTNLYVTKHL